MTLKIQFTGEPGYDAGYLLDRVCDDNKIL